LPLDERAVLAARAQIRHEHTDYHHWLDELPNLGEAGDLFPRVSKRRGHRCPVYRSEARVPRL